MLYTHCRITSPDILDHLASRQGKEEEKRSKSFWFISIAADIMDNKQTSQDVDEESKKSLMNTFRWPLQQQIKIIIVWYKKKHSDILISKFAPHSSQEVYTDKNSFARVHKEIKNNIDLKIISAPDLSQKNIDLVYKMSKKADGLVIIHTNSNYLKEYEALCINDKKRKDMPIILIKFKDKIKNDWDKKQEKNKISAEIELLATIYKRYTFTEENTEIIFTTITDQILNKISLKCKINKSIIYFYDF